MAANVLGLFFVLLWISGLVKSIYMPTGWVEKVDHPWNVLPHSKWRYYTRYRDRFPNLLNENNFLPNLESRISRVQFKPDAKFENFLPSIKRVHDEGLIRGIPSFNSIENSFIEQSTFSSPVTNILKESQHPDFDQNAKNSEYMYSTKVQPENNMKATTGSDSLSPLKSSVLHLEPRDSHPVTDTETSSESGRSTTPPRKDLDSAANSQGTTETDEVSTRNDLTSSPERNSLSTENSTATDVTEQQQKETISLKNNSDSYTTEHTSGNDASEITSTENSTATDVTEEQQKETISPKNNSDSYTTEHTTGNDASEITSSTDTHGNGSEDYNNTLNTDRASASTPDGNTESTNINIGSSVSYISTTPSAIQTEGSTSPSTSYSTDGDEIQSTTNQVITASETESIATSTPSTIETDEISSTTMGFTKSEFVSTTKGFTKSEFISTTVGFTKSEFVSTTVDFTESSTRGGNEVTESVSHDHIIKIKSIRTARVIVSVVFIVIALVAVVALAIYTFRVKRRAPQYDQLMLLP